MTKPYFENIKCVIELKNLVLKIIFSGFTDTCGSFFFERSKKLTISISNSLKEYFLFRTRKVKIKILIYSGPFFLKHIVTFLHLITFLGHPVGLHANKTDYVQGKVWF